ncbi:SOS-response transcriptional repressor LexA (RecA-mediated autopeptidase) (LexA) (PDB:1AY9) [Commensalibacter communis]|uniref:SOS-response transcriptional repressor LexA (RecA-mediated autopeptidase) (LexA) n=1 Tax=Commensalibacter communis TaxID=2972786 RepID=A0A9W4X7R2_9PROT|nr:XRE family transcriptional regulator [Commensalibacter communis]CAI3960614.1 SOS-response transcriptional repressor LexA (RecA-mediated autopeptidase) (LexA) (PDB:1AY9) [Commensalibacter communis]CAI3962121.1 SOS-response transcriptional repressor LexA (RecA-mediated autopeptidase) (LexA) (PDB:1AY9) [Commensalibacter communis]
MKNRILLDKINEVLEKKNIKPSRAGREAGLGPDFIRKLKTSKNSPKTENLFKLANYLNVDPNIFFDPIEETIQKMALSKRPMESLPEIQTHAIPTETIYIKGAIESKKWTDEKEWRSYQHTPFIVPKHEDFPSTSLSAYIINDDSMNLIYPKGSILITSPFEELQKMPENGDTVIVVKFDCIQRTYETTAKIVQFRENGQLYLWPKTDNPLLLAPTMLPRLTLKYYNPMLSLSSEEPDVEIKSLVIGHYQLSRKIFF